MSIISFTDDVVALHVDERLVCAGHSLWAPSYKYRHRPWQRQPAIQSQWLPGVLYVWPGGGAFQLS